MNFDVRAFHDEMLGAGALPLDLLEQRMDALGGSRKTRRKCADAVKTDYRALSTAELDSDCD